MRIEAATSSRETADVMAATITAMKNAVPTTRPSASICANALGSEMKRTPRVLSPTSSDSPSPKTIGKTTSPATKATEKSDSAITALSRPRFVFLER